MSWAARLAGIVLVLVALGGALFWFLTRPIGLDEAQRAALSAGEASRGERIFWAGGCSSCHARPGSSEEGLVELAGGLTLQTPFGDFVAPNISPHRADGIGAWSLEDFANAMLRGVSPEGRHYYPSFPYTSYARMAPGDVADLHAFIMTLPEVAGKAAGHTLSFPYSMRRGVGLWKRLHLDAGPVVELKGNVSDELLVGRALVEGAGHCGECHTPRDLTGGLKKDAWLAGARAVEGEPGAIIPNITGGQGGIGAWSQGDIAYFLETGFTPEFDTVGGTMAAVQRNMARLTSQDRAAIAAYLKAIEAKPPGYREPGDQS